jgi:hypothetical protein
MLQENPSTLTETTSLLCHLFLCIKGRVGLPTYQLIPLSPCFLPCPPMRRGRQGPLRPRQVALLLMTFYPLTSIMLFIMVLYLVMCRLEHFCFVFFCPCDLVVPARLPALLLIKVSEPLHSV